MEIDVTPIIVALITSLGGIVGAFLAVRKGNKENAIKEVQREQDQAVRDAIREQQQADRFKELTNEMNEIKKRLDIHNGYAEKFGTISQSLIALSKDVEYLRKRGK